ncbi:hypothetical protein OAX78_02350, partial [Planctomycetota bacterium]|nr:hypothetical protein [Planctomycetota bacterium]
QPMDYRCDPCGRTMTRPLGELVDLARRRRAKCQMCGSALSLPPEVEQALGGLEAEGRTQRKQAPQPCLVCGRKLGLESGSPDALHTCAFCTASMRGPGQPDGPLRPPALDMPAASPEDVQSVVADLGGSHGKVVASILGARARLGTVTMAEVITVAARMRRLEGWKPQPSDPELVLPVPVDDAVDVVPGLFFGGQDFSLDRGVKRGVDLVFVVDASNRVTWLDVSNALNLATAMVGLGGVLVLGSDERTSVQHRMRVSIWEQHGEDQVGVRLASQVDNGKPKVLPARGLIKALAVRRKALRSYYCLLALFGSWAAGAPLFRATEPAIAARLNTLGGVLARDAAKLAPQLCVASHMGR